MFMKNNPIAFKSRMKELFFDYLVILLYLALLFVVMMVAYHLFFKGIPKMNELQAQVIALLTSVIPIILLFAYLDYSKDGSIGKRKAGLKLVYRDKSFQASLIRNVIKFLPWQISHMSTIHGIYTDFDAWAMGLFFVSIGFAVLLLLMGLMRNDKRHLGDLLAHTQVQKQ
ncbi:MULTISPECIES: RDD family protein [Aerococcus]|uniref:RDD family protein n=3 Tax=Aerococcus TaxID=1375 RepID=A0A2I1L5K4_9LACT|nr:MULTISPECIES: RDD family protein [Aerococcus]KAA9217188.1 RDD family protein [Aerococcus loyolae]KAA9265518.1 RDD family protein [Aerococcus loyolae]MDK6257499.1 RDD family protein [Aerococcus urinae]MDL5181486.1 RDD family protein [Aerococcus loyolae]PKY82706.1 RDD family protein [Aerococcus loyolae]